MCWATFGDVLRFLWAAGSRLGIDGVDKQSLVFQIQYIKYITDNYVGRAKSTKKSSYFNSMLHQFNEIEFIAPSEERVLCCLPPLFRGTIPKVAYDSGNVTNLAPGHGA